MVVSSAAAVRRRLASLGARKFAPAAPAAHRGTERLLRAPGRADFRAAHAALFAAGRVDAVATGTNAAVAFLDRGGLFEDMGRDNDVSHYFVGRGRRGKTEVSRGHRRRGLHRHGTGVEMTASRARAPRPVPRSAHRRATTSRSRSTRAGTSTACPAPWCLRARQLRSPACSRACRARS